MKTLTSFFQKSPSDSAEQEQKLSKVCRHDIAKTVYAVLILTIDLFDETTNSTSPSPTVSFIKEIFDLKSWLNPLMEQLHGHSLPHCFKFILCTDDKTGSKVPVMYYKSWSSANWCTDNDAIQLLKV